jgi:hypothetical protein
VYDEAENAVSACVDGAGDYDAMLQVFRNKGLLEAIGNAFKIGRDKYIQRVVELLRTNDDLRKKLREFIGLESVLVDQGELSK